MKGFRTRGGRWAAGLSAGVLFWLAGCEPKADHGAGADQTGGGGAGREELAARPEGKPEEAAAEPVVPAEPVAPAPVPVPAAEPLPAPAQPAPEKVAWTLAHAGFAAHLPPDLDLYADARELGWVGELAEQLALREKLDAWLERAELRFDPGQDTIEAACEMMSQIMEREAFVAVRGLGTVLDAAGEISAEMNRVLGREMTRAIASANLFAMADEDFGADMQAEIAKWILRNVEKVGDRGDFALYAGGRVPDGKRAELLERLAGLLAGLAEKVEAVEAVQWQHGKTTWSGVEVRIGEIEGFGEAEAPEGMDEEGWEKLKAEVGNWKVALAGAEVDGYVVVAAGLGRDAIVLADAPEHSLASTEPYRFFAEFDAEAVRGTAWMSKAAVEGGSKWNSYLPMFEGVEEGLKATPKLTHKDGMVKALAEMNGHWRARRAGVAHDFVGAVLVGEEVRIESRGGWLSAGVDLESPLKFAKDFDAIREKLFVRAHWKKSAAHVALGKKLLEAGKKALRLVAEEAMDAALSTAREGKDEESEQNLTRWKRDLLNGIDDLWQGYDEHFSHAFGTEAAFVMDLDGKMIPAVGVGPETVEKGRIPRAAYVRPIVKREALTESWTLWHRASTNMFGILAEAVNQPIPFPDTMTTEKDDLRTYFFRVPVASDDFLPSVSVSDELYILGSSKTLSESLYEASRVADEKVVAPGVRVEMNADSLWEFCGIWLDLHEKRRAMREEIEGEEQKLLEAEVEDRMRRELEDLAEDEHRAEGVGDEDLDAEAEFMRSYEEMLAQSGLDEDVKKELRNSLKEDDEPEHDHALPEAERREVKPPPPGPELPGSLRSPQDPPAIREPSRYLVPEEEIPNPLLRELMGEQDGEVPQIEDGLEFRFDPLRAEELGMEELGMEEALPDEFGLDEFGDGPLSGPARFFSFLPEPEVLRSLLEKARWFRGFTYHRRLEDGVPRATLKVRLQAP